MTHALLAALAVAAALGCRAPRFPSSVAAEDPVREREWRAGVFVPPRATTSQQRALLTVHGSQLDFSLLLQARRPDELRFVALDDLGGTLFHVLRTGAGTRVLQGSPFLDDDFLAYTLGQGLALLLLGLPDDGLSLVRLESGALALHGSLGEGEALLERARDGAEPERALLGREGRLQGSLCVLEWRRDGDGRALFPVRFVVSDAGEERRLEVRVIEWRVEGSP